MAATLSPLRERRATSKLVFFTADQAADYFGVNRETIYRWVKADLLKHCPRNGRALRFLQQHFDDFLLGRAEPKPAAEKRPTRNPKYANR